MIRVYTPESMSELLITMGDYVRPHQLERAFLVALVPYCEPVPCWLGERSPIARGGREVIKVKVGPALYNKIVIFSSIQ